MDEPETTAEVVESAKPTAKEFEERYKELCDEMGFRIVVTPVWIARDDGSFSTVIQTSIGELPLKSN